MIIKVVELVERRIDVKTLLKITDEMFKIMDDYNRKLENDEDACWNTKKVFYLLDTYREVRNAQESDFNDSAGNPPNNPGV